MNLGKLSCTNVKAALSMTTQQFIPDEMNISDRYKLLIGCVVPRPIALVSTVSSDGRMNLAPFSFFAGVGSNPMTVLFCPANRADGGEKDSLRNAKPVDEGGMGEFVINASSEMYERQVAASADDLPYGVSEFEAVGLTPAPSAIVKPPRVLESPWSFECKTTNVVRTQKAAPSAGNIVIGRVVSIHISRELVNNRLHVDPRKLRAIGRMGGSGYCRTSDLFEMPTGGAAINP